MTDSRCAHTALAAALSLLAACGPTHVATDSSFVNHVRDGTPVRFAVHRARRVDSVVTGTALSWQRGTPRLITTRGDTVAIPAGSKVDVQGDKKVRHPWVGLIAGLAVGGIVVQLDCGGQEFCGEQDPRPLIGMLAGTLIGSLIQTDRWVRVRWDGPSG